MRRELLLKYALLSAQTGAPEASSNSLDEDEFVKVRAHVAICPSCSLRVKAYRQLYLSHPNVPPEIVAQELSSPECIDEASHQNGLAHRKSGAKSFPAYGRVAVVAMILLFAAGLSTLIADRFTRPKYYSLASVRSDRYDQIILYRERNSLLQAIFLFRSGNYERAIDAIETTISTKDGYNMRPYLRLMQGLAYLKLAESSTHGLFPRFDINRAEAAAVTFQACIDEAVSAELLGVRSSAYIYQAKAYLMSGNLGLAQQALRAAMACGDEHAEQAKQILDKLQKSESGTQYFR
ncbi:MAG: hypothetical protein ONB43_26980 [candidate division KSB1 bacterium]|nr:hypothetical protein [candidate division KSB1 bacterium]